MRKARLHTIADSHNMDIINWLKNIGKSAKKEGRGTAFGASIRRGKFNEGKGISKNFSPPYYNNYNNYLNYLKDFETSG